MKRIYVSVWLVLLLVLFVSGCTRTGNILADVPSGGSEELESTCNPPYIKVGNGCCLDLNSNDICDNDEETQQEPLETTPETTEKTTAIISKVIDGDTIKLKTGETVRLLGINAPERGQPYYEESKNRLRELVEGKTVTLEKDVEDDDQYGRLLRYVLLDNENINVKLLKGGLAITYTTYPNEKYETQLMKAESEAMRLKLGLWAPPAPIEDKDTCDEDCIATSYFHWNAAGNDCHNLDDEYVVFKNSCRYSCDLTAWTVKDESSRNPYVFPIFVLESGAEVTLYTGCGTNTKTRLHWCSGGYSCNAIWNNKGGDTLYLRNSDGKLVLSYHYSGY